MIEDNDFCLRCGGRGTQYDFLEVINCDACGGTGRASQHDPMAKPIYIFIALFAAYMFWQFFIR